MLAEKGSRVEFGDHLAGLVRLEVADRHFGRGTAAAGPHADDVQIFLVDVAEDEAVFRLRALGHCAKVMAGGGEHLGGPFLRDSRVEGGDGQRQGNGGKKRFSEGCGSCGEHAGDTGGDEGCHAETSGEQR